MERRKKSSLFLQMKKNKKTTDAQLSPVRHLIPWEWMHVMQCDYRVFNNPTLKAGLLAELSMGLTSWPIPIRYKRYRALPSSVTHTRAWSVHVHRNQWWHFCLYRVFFSVSTRTKLVTNISNAYTTDMVELQCLVFLLLVSSEWQISFQRFSCFSIKL